MLVLLMEVIRIIQAVSKSVYRVFTCSAFTNSCSRINGKLNSAWNYRGMGFDVRLKGISDLPKLVGLVNIAWWNVVKILLLF